MRCKPLGSTELAGLEIEEDLEAQRIIWLFERLGWAGLSLFVLAGLLGAFGGGSASQADARDMSGRLTVRFERFARVDTPTTLEVRVTGAQQRDLLWLHLSKVYLDQARIDRIMPEPERILVAEDMVRFGFDPSQAGEHALIIINLTPTQFGQLRGSLALADGTVADFTQIIYP